MPLVPTQPNIEQSLVDVSDGAKETHLFGGSNAENLAALVDTIIANSNWPGGSGLQTFAISARSQLARLMRNTLLAPSLDVIFRGYLNFIDSEFRTVRTGWENIFDGFDGNTRRVTSRAPTFDTTPTTGGTGNPTWRRLTIDKDAYDIESIWADDISVECIQSLGLGSVLGEEQIRFTITNAIDLFSLLIAGEENGNGAIDTMRLINGDNEGLTDLSFESEDSANASPTDLGGWLQAAGSYTNYSLIEDGYRLSVREADFGTAENPGNKIALRIADDDTIFQELRNISRREPYDWGIWARKETSAIGTLRVDVGSNQTASVDISTLSDATWTFVGPDLDENLWPDNWDQGTPRIQIVTTGMNGTNGVDVDATSFRKMKYYNGTFWHPVPGDTALQTDYTAVFNDLIASDSVIQRFVFFVYGLLRNSRGVGYYLPHISAAAEIGDP